MPQSKTQRVIAKINTYSGNPTQQGAAFFAEFNAVEPPVPFAASAYAELWANDHDEKHGATAALPWE